MRHEIHIDGPNPDEAGRAPIGDPQLQLPSRGRCECGWKGPSRDSRLVAHIDAKRHLVDTAFETKSDAPTRSQNTPK